MGVTPQDVRRVADLARLDLETGQVEGLARQLTGILGHMAELQDAAVDDVAGAPPEPNAAPLRSDESTSDPLAFPPRDMAPAWAHGFFTLPRLPALGDAAESNQSAEQS